MAAFCHCLSGVAAMAQCLQVICRMRSAINQRHHVMDFRGRRDASGVHTFITQGVPAEKSIADPGPFRSIPFSGIRIPLVTFIAGRCLLPVLRTIPLVCQFRASRPAAGLLWTLGQNLPPGIRKAQPSVSAELSLFFPRYHLTSCPRYSQVFIAGIFEVFLRYCDINYLRQTDWRSFHQERHCAGPAHDSCSYAPQMPHRPREVPPGTEASGHHADAHRPAAQFPA